MPCDPNDWRAYYTSEFSAPGPSVAWPYIEQLESVLSNSSLPDFTVTVSDVTANVFKLNKKKSRGVDCLCALHLVNSTRLLYEVLTLLYQIIFVVGIVPDVFCRGQVAPILKKGKPANICSSYYPITVSPFLCKLFEMLILQMLENAIALHMYGI